MQQKILRAPLMASGSVKETLLLDLESAFKSRDANERSVVLERITALFLAGTRDQDQVELFDDIFLQLVEQVEATARARLSERLAHLKLAPSRLIKSLAYDDEISVAGPVLSYSSQVSEDSLIEIARTQSQAHLLSIAGRSQVGETVSDVLVDRGDDEVLRRLSGNAAARFSETGLSGLATRGASNEKIAVNMANRSDVPPRIFRYLLNQATNAVRNSLLEGASSQQRGIISQVLDEVCQEIGRPAAHEITVEVRRGVYEALEKGKLNESTVLEFARSDMLAEVAVSLAVLTTTSIDIVEQQMLSGRMSGLLLLCKAKDFKWPTAKMIISVARERSASELEQARQEYYALSVQTAVRALRFVGAKGSMIRELSDGNGSGPLMKPAIRTLLSESS
jgi:uncharacterized protein (DUF2336 family)